jgi:hypothetical protein
VRSAHRDYRHAEEWLLIEWPESESEPTKYWFSTLPADLSLADIVHHAKHRWIIERDYEELKQELGWVTLKGEAGADFTTMRLSASSRMGSWSPSGAVFPPPHAPGILDYAPRNSHEASGRAVPFGPTAQTQDQPCPG